MKYTYFEKGLAFVAALIVLIGVSSAASIALAGDVGSVELYVSAHI